MADINLFLKSYTDNPMTLEARANHLGDDSYTLNIRTMRGYAKVDDITIFTTLENLESVVAEMVTVLAEVKAKANA